MKKQTAKQIYNVLYYKTTGMVSSKSHLKW